MLTFNNKVITFDNSALYQAGIYYSGVPIIGYYPDPTARPATFLIEPSAWTTIPELPSAITLSANGHYSAFSCKTNDTSILPTISASGGINCGLWLGDNLYNNTKAPSEIYLGDNMTLLHIGNNTLCSATGTTTIYTKGVVNSTFEFGNNCCTNCNFVPQDIGDWRGVEVIIGEGSLRQLTVCNNMTITLNGTPGSKPSLYPIVFDFQDTSNKTITIHGDLPNLFKPNDEFRKMIYIYRFHAQYANYYIKCDSPTIASWCNENKENFMSAGWPIALTQVSFTS